MKKLADAISERDWLEIVEALVAEAKQGNAAAARLLINAAFGSGRWLKQDGKGIDADRRKARLLRILKTQTGDNEHDGASGRSDTSGSVATA